MLRSCIYLMISHIPFFFDPFRIMIPASRIFFIILSIFATEKPVSSAYHFCVALGAFRMQAKSCFSSSDNPSFIPSFIPSSAGINGALSALCAVLSSILFLRMSFTVFGVSSYSGAGKPADEMANIGQIPRLEKMYFRPTTARTPGIARFF